MQKADIRLTNSYKWEKLSGRGCRQNFGLKDKERAKILRFWTSSISARRFGIRNDSSLFWAWGKCKISTGGKRLQLSEYICLVENIYQERHCRAGEWKRHNTKKRINRGSLSDTMVPAYPTPEMYSPFLPQWYGLWVLIVELKGDAFFTFIKSMLIHGSCQWIVRLSEVKTANAN